jgi:hypothetical protein
VPSVTPLGSQVKLQSVPLEVAVPRWTLSTYQRTLAAFVEVLMPLQVIVVEVVIGEAGVQLIAVTDGAKALPGSLRTASWRTVTGVSPGRWLEMTTATRL